jgi:hypothetical protein
MTVEELREARFRFLKALYDAVGGSLWTWPEMHELGASLGFDHELTGRVTDYLSGEGLVQYRALGGIISITHEGIRQVEDAMSHPDRPTRYFPAVNVIHIGSMVNSSILQASPGATQTVQVGFAADQALLAVLGEIKQSIDRLGLTPEDQNDLKGDVATVEAQLTTSKPKRSIVSECLTSNKSLLEKGGEALAKGLADILVEHIIK